jgi:gliding motility-associated-like protein
MKQLPLNITLFVCVVMGIWHDPIPAACQNILKNSSFEEFDKKPTGPQGYANYQGNGYYFIMPGIYLWFFNEREYAKISGTSPGYGVPNTAYGYQYPRTGHTMLAIGGTTTFSVVFVLDNPLKAGLCYKVSYYLNRTAIYACATDAINAYFSKVPMTFQILDKDTLKPQIINPTGVLYDTMNWMRVEQSYTATGTEQFLTIGMLYGLIRKPLCVIDCLDSTIVIINNHVWLYPYFNGGLYFIDDVAIWECGAPEYPADAGPDKKICAGEQAELGNNIPRDQYLYFWSDRSWHGPRHTWDTLAATPKFTVSPTKTTTYYLWSIDFKWEHTYDSVTVYVENCNIDLEIPNVFTPNGDGYNDYFMIRNPNQVSYTLEVFNRWGNLVFQGNQNYFWNGTFNGEPAPAGVYFYVLKATTTDGTFNKEFHGSVTILR